MLARLAYVQLYRLLRILERRVVLDRKVHHIRNRSPNSSIALDIYMAAQSCNPPSRRQLIERKNLAKRWSDLAGRWAIFVLLYSEDAEDIMFEKSILYCHTILLTFLHSRCHRRPDRTAFQLVAGRILDNWSGRLHKVCEIAEQGLEAAAQSNKQDDIELLVLKCQNELRTPDHAMLSTTEEGGHIAGS